MSMTAILEPFLN